MITLYNFGPFHGLPEGSPHVMKTEIQLRLAGLDYVKDNSAGLAKAPKGKLPFIDDAGEIVADTIFIRAHIERKYGFDFDRGLDKAERAEAWATERMIEDHLYWSLLHMRWAIPENFERGPARFFDGAPEAVREQIRAGARERVLGYLQAQGMGRHSLAEITELGERSLAALSALLGKRPWLMGEQPCGTDASMTGMLASLLTPQLDSVLRQRAVTYDNLTAYVDRAMAQFYPEHKWQAVSAARKAESPALAFA
jgi:glutathione S-transferase